MAVVFAYHRKDLSSGFAAASQIAGFLMQQIKELSFGDYPAGGD